jgi:hypothetical protein
MQYINSISFHDDNLNILTRSLNFLGNVFLTPARYTLGGRTGTCFQIIEDRRFIAGQGRIYLYKDFYGNIEEKKSNVIKTALSVALFIPCLIIGTAFKAPALLCSERLRRRYDTFENLTKLEDKAYHELRIGISLIEEKHINNYSKYVEEMADPDTFFDDLQIGKNIFTGSIFQPIIATQLSRLKNKEITPQDYLESF